MEKKEWFEKTSNLIEKNKSYYKYKYKCRGKGNLKVYKLFEGIELVFMDFNTNDKFIPDAPHSDIVEISWCIKGRVECEFKNNTVSYLQEYDFGVNKNDYIPEFYRFPLGIYKAVSIVINKRECSKQTKELMENFCVNIDYLFCDLKKSMYILRENKRLKTVYEEIIKLEKKEDKSYFCIKCIELLHIITNLQNIDKKEIKYYKKEQINKVKEIKKQLIKELDENLNIENCVIKNKMKITTFRKIFKQIYGETPSLYLIKYKMTKATKLLEDKTVSIMDIAMQLGYSNSSKFSKMFKNQYGISPKDYRKNIDD